MKGVDQVREGVAIGGVSAGDERPAPQRAGFSFRAPSRAALAIGLALLVGLALVTPLATLFLPAVHKTILWTTAVWGLLLVASFAGWGAALEQVLFRSASADYGLRAAWGFGFTTVVGGVFCLFGIAVRGVLATYTATGVLLLCAVVYRERGTLLAAAQELGVAAAHRPLVALAFAFLPCAALAQFFGSIGDRGYNDCDDFVCYFQFARQIIDSGSFIEPFSLRRLSTMGGQPFLHALLLVESSEFRLHVIDRGVCLLVLVALVLGQARTRRVPLLLLFVGTLIPIALPNTRINISSQMSGAICFFALYRTLGYVGTVSAPPFAAATALALIGASACTLRQNYMAPVAVALAVSYGSLLWARRRSDWRAGLREALLCVAMTAAWLAPWALVFYRSSGTFLFPLMKGHFRPDFPMLQSVGDAWAQLRFLFANFAHVDPVHTLPLFLLAGLFVREQDERRPIQSMVVGAMLGFVLLVRTFSLSDPPNLSRYYYAFVVGTVLAVYFGTLETAKLPRDPLAWSAPALLSLVAAVLQLHEMRGGILGMYQYELQNLESQVKAKEPFPLPQDDSDRSYRALQASVPAGEKVLVMADDPYRFDFGRNHIYNFDIPDAVSPDGRLPVFQGADPVAEYLLRNGIRYLAFIP
ncbi:MAG: hypothetical protein JOZ69_22110, partial [Myxococcales bacterium]|nr:hypothetical protein [Myxococcales bacterium]